MRKILNLVIKLIILLIIFRHIQSRALARMEITATVKGLPVEQNQTIDVIGGEAFVFEITDDREIQKIEVSVTEDDAVFQWDDFVENATSYEFEVLDIFPGGTNLTVNFTVTAVQGGTVQKQSYQYHLHYREYAEFTFGESIWGMRLEKYNGNMRKVEVPAEYEGWPVCVIGSGAFSNIETLNEVVLPDTIEYIQEGAFYNTTLARINLPKSLREIEENAFAGCYLWKIDLPEGVTNIAENAFAGNVLLEEVNFSSNLRSIGARAFSECEAIEKIVIPNDVMEIGDEAFYGCKNLKEVQLPKNLRALGKGAFSFCDELQEIILPEGLEKIGTGAFACDYKLKSLIIPTTVNKIEGNPAWGADIQLIAPAGNKFYAMAYFGLYDRVTGTYIALNDRNQTEAFIPEGIQSIAPYAFESSRIEQISLPSTLKQIGENAFAGAPISAIDFPDGTISIGQRAFMGCSQLKRLRLPDTIEFLGEMAFAACEGIEEIELSSELRFIPDSAFFNCASLKSVIIPEQVTIIEPFAFQGCEQMRVIYLQGKIDYIGKYALPYVEDNLLAIGNGGDAAEEYCKTNGIQYMLTEDAMSKGILTGGTK